MMDQTASAHHDGFENRLAKTENTPILVDKEEEGLEDTAMTDDSEASSILGNNSDGLQEKVDVEDNEEGGDTEDGDGPTETTQEELAEAENTFNEEQDNDKGPRVDFAPTAIIDDQDLSITEWDETEYDDGSLPPTVTAANHNRRSSITQATLFDERNKNENIKPIYGRDGELDSIRQAYQRLKEPPYHSQAVFLAGYSGCGKTALVDEAMHIIREEAKMQKTKHPWIIRGKYDEMRTPLPYKGLSEAFARWYRALSSTQKNALIPHVQNKLHAEVGDDAESLVEILPALSKLITGDDNEADDGSEAYEEEFKTNTRSIVTNGGFDHLERVSKNRVQFAFRTLVSILTELGNTNIILFADDLQWADLDSLELIESMLSYNGDEPPVPRFLFMGSYRSNEVPSTHPLAVILKRLPLSRPPEASLQVMSLSDLPLSQVRVFIADALNKPHRGRRITALAKAVYARTVGNMFFTKQALEALVRQNAIFCDGTGQWDWIMSEQELADALPGDIRQVVKSKIDSLSPELQRILIVASYTRSTFDVDTLVVLLNSTPSLSDSVLVAMKDGEDKTEKTRTPSSSTTGAYTSKSLTIYLEQAVADGLLTTGSNVRKNGTESTISSTLASETEDASASLDVSEHSYHSKEYSFAHDRILEQVSQLISGKLLDQLKFELGNALVDRSTEEIGEDWMLFIGMHHLNSSPPELFSDAAGESLRLRMSRLNLKSAEESMGKAAFEVAHGFAAKGIEFLPGDGWISQLQLSHDLYRLAAESCRLTGQIAQMEQYCRVCLEALKDRPLGSKFQVSYTLAQGLLYGEGRYEEAKTILMELLDHLGCKYPRTSIGTTMRVVYNLLRLAISRKKRLRREDVKGMPFMTDSNKVDAMKLLSKMIDACYLSEDDERMALSLFRSLDYTLNHGVSVDSSRPVAALSILFTSVLNDLKGAGECSEFGLGLMEKADHRPTQAGALFVAHWAGLPWVRPIRECIEPQRQAFSVGITTEQADDASWGINHCLCFAMQAGHPSLDHIQREWARQVPRMEAAGQKLHALFSASIQKCVLRLTGNDEEAEKIVIDYDLEMAQKPQALLTLKLYEKYSDAYLGNYQAAADIAVKYKNGYRESNPGNPLCMMDTFASAISCYDQFGKTLKAKYKKEAKRQHALIDGWVKQGNPNVIHWQYLLDAEMLSITSNGASSSKKASLGQEAEDKYRKAIRLAQKEGFVQDAALAHERLALHVLKDPIPSNKARVADYLKESVKLFQKWGAMGKVNVMRKQYPSFLES